MEAINQDGKSIVGASVVILGLSYKPDIDDDRESPSFELIEMLRERGAHVAYCDPYIPQSHRGRKFDQVMTSVPCTAEEMSKFKDADLYKRTKLVIDTRNIVAPNNATRVVRA